MIVHDCAQRSDAWLTARLGKLNASRAGDMLATLKNGSEAASRRDLRVQLCLERLTGQSRYATRYRPGARSPCSV